MIQTRRLEPLRRQHHMSYQHREEVRPVPREFSQRSEQRANCQTQPIPLQGLHQPITAVITRGRAQETLQCQLEAVNLALTEAVQ